MSYLNGIGISSVMSQYGNSAELLTLREMQANLGVPNSYGLTPKGKAAIAQTEVQEEDNTTFLFEYRAYLNSQLTTLVTKLTNALTSDLDVSMMRISPSFGGKSNMQGRTDNVNMDPGAGRVSQEYLGTWRSAGQITVNQSVDQGPWAMSGSGPGSWTLDIQDGTKTQSNTSNSASGTFAVITYGNNPIGTNTIPNDTLMVNFNNLSGNKYNQAGKQTSFNVTDTAATNASAGNKFEEVLFRESRTAVFRNILKADLLRDLVVSASSSLSTGSQVQASISLNARMSDKSPYPSLTSPGGPWNAAVDMFLTRFTAFYHT